MHSSLSKREDNNGGGKSTFTCVKKCINVCRSSFYCSSEIFHKYESGSYWDDKECSVTVKSEAEEAEAQADSNDGGYETFGDTSSMEDILNMNGDPDMYEDILEDALDDPDASVNTILNAFGQGSSTTRARVITSAGISLFTAASIAFLFW